MTERLKELLERASDVQPRDLVVAAERTASRRTRAARWGVAGTVAAVAALVAGGVVVADHDPAPRREDPAGPTSTGSTTSPSSPTGAAVTTDADAIAQPVWDPFTLADAPQGQSALPPTLEVPATGASVLDDPLPAAVLATAEEGSDIALLSPDGQWRTVPGTADAPGAYASPMVGGPALDADGSRMAVSTEPGLLVVDVTTGDRRMLPWPKRLAGPWDTAPALVWRGDEVIVLHWRESWVASLDGSFERSPYRAGYGGGLAVAPDGSLYLRDFEDRTLATWVGDEVERTVPFGWWGQRFAAGYGLVAFVGGTHSGGSRGGPMVVDPATGSVLAYAPIKDPNAVYSDNGHLTPVGFLDADTVLLQVKPARFGRDRVLDGPWYLVAWDFRSGDFERLSTGSQAWWPSAVVPALVRGG